MSWLRAPGAIDPRNVATLTARPLAVGHPNVPQLFIRVQTTGEITPREAVVDTIKKLMMSLSHLAQEFIREYELRRVVEARQNDQANGQ